MARLQFDLKPLPHPFGDTPEELEEHMLWMNEVFAKHHPGETPRPCDCGYFEPTHPVSCHEEHRRRFCYRDPLKRLEHTYRERHLKALREKRVFPGAPFRGAKGVCWWCGEALPRTKKGTIVQRVFHNGRNGEPDCAHQEDLHTQMTVQRAFLLKRDGLGCRACGGVEGKWSAWARLDDQDLVDRWWAGDGWAGRSWMKGVFKERPGPLSLVTWHTSLEVDHVVALALVAHLPAEKRRPYFGPTNLQLLCAACHKVKTRSDTRAIRALQTELKAGLSERAPPDL
jgi:hypothetical protein